MGAILSLLIVISLSILIIRIGTVAFTMTGLAEDVARFQSLSAFSGAGFTTSEAESIVKDPARRKIVSLLIRLGSAGVVTAISTLVLSFVGAEGALSERLLVLLGGLVLIIIISRSDYFNRLLTPLIQHVLKRYTKLDLHDYADLLHLHQNYRVVEIEVEQDSWLGSKRLKDLNLPAEGVIILGVLRAKSGKYIGAPGPDLQLRIQDQVILYGRAPRLKELSDRFSGNEAAHEAAKADHQREVEEMKDE